jgi:hypothetical protein
VRSFFTFKPIDETIITFKNLMSAILGYTLFFLNFISLVAPACLLDGGSVTSNTGGFPWLFGGVNYDCVIQGVIDNWSTSDIGFSGYCEDSSSNYYGLLGDVSIEGDTLNN